MTDYIYKKGNFDTSMIDSVYQSEGQFDQYNLTGAELALLEDELIVNPRRRGASLNEKKWRYEFAFTPNFGFLASPEPLPNNCELKLSFARSDWKTSLIKYGTVTETCTGLKIEDCYAISEYVSSPKMRDYFEQINYSPLTYTYDDCDVIIKSMPQSDTEIQFHNLRGGHCPKYVFAGLIPQANLNGNEGSSSTRFSNHNVEEFNIMFNGNSVNGYPIQVKNINPVYAMHKFHEVTGRLHNLTCGSGLTLQAFKYNWIWAHHFEEDTTGNGWMGITMKLTSPVSQAMALVVWVISENTLTIDKYHQIEKIN